MYNAVNIYHSKTQKVENVSSQVKHHIAPRNHLDLEPTSRNRKHSPLYHQSPQTSRLANTTGRHVQHALLWRASL